MWGYFCIGFIGFMLKGKSLLFYTNLFSCNGYEKNGKIILIKKKKKKHDKIVLFKKSKLNSIEVLIFKTLINSVIRHDVFLLIKNFLK